MRILSVLAAVAVGIAAGRASPGPAPSQLRGQPPTLRSSAKIAGSVGARLDEHMRELEAIGFSGAVLVARGKEILLERGYGTLALDDKRPVTQRSVFDIGSITKQFTATAILKLELAGRLRTSDPITTYFDDVPPDKADITLHQLLTHSAGMGGLYRGDTVVVTRDETVRQILERPLKFAPGERYYYSNPGYTLLGILVEIVSGEPYERYIHAQLLTPAGMTQTGYRLAEWNRSQLASDSFGETDWGPAFERVWGPFGPHWSLMAAGGLLSTVGDMFRWDLALRGDRILPEAAKRRLFAPHVVADERGGHYGYGWAISESERGTTVIWHTGGSMFGTRARHSRFVDDGLTVIVLSNHAPVPGDEDGKLAERLAALVLAADGSA